MNYCGVGFVFEGGGMHQIVTSAEEAKAIYARWRTGALPELLADSNAQFPWGLKTKSLVCVGLFAVAQDKVGPGDVKRFDGIGSGIN